MEEVRYWMWAKRKQCLMSSYGDSWEEQAFAEDSARSLEGCIWPPRSYSCSFCGREFRSAQALGGHMNVHRRDRARLKQSSSSPPHTEILHPIDVAVEYQPSQVRKFLYSPNPNPNTNTAVTVASSLSPARVFTNSDPKKTEGEKNLRVTHEDVTVNWDLGAHRNQPEGSGGGDGEEELAFIRKRRRSNDALPFFCNSISIDRLGVCTNPVEDLDLELRLGDGPEVLFECWRRLDEYHSIEEIIICSYSLRMEVDPTSPERNSDQVPAGGISSEPTQHQQVRSYECTFCKRGFSNAQALGGHMNIHRRDRAKLKEPSSPITRKNSSSPPFHPAISTEPSFLELESSEDNIRQPWPIAREFRQLQLFSERPSGSYKSNSDERTTQVTTDTSSDDKELDLELRLGHES